MSNILHGRASLSNQKIQDLQIFLGKLYLKEPFYIFFNDDTNSIKYEHDLFFDIIEGAQKQINKYIPGADNNIPNIRTHSLTTLDIAFSEWGTQRIDIIIEKMIREIWDQTVILLPEAKKVDKLIELSDLHPDKSPLFIKEGLYDYMFIMIKSIYKSILEFDLSPAFPHQSFRFQTYNQLTTLNRKKVQDRAVVNLFSIVNAVSNIINNIPYPSDQWYDRNSRITVLRAISEHVATAFKNFTEKYGNDFQLNAFK